MNSHNSHCSDEYWNHAPGWPGSRASSDSLPGQQANAWRDALTRLASPIIRLHHLRNIRTQMLYDALADLETRNGPDPADDDA